MIRRRDAYRLGDEWRIEQMQYEEKVYKEGLVEFYW